LRWPSGEVATTPKLPPATLTRAIFIDMKRRKRDEPIEKFRHVLRSRLCRWAADNMEALRTADPAIPTDFQNRYGDNWRMQFAIADLAGEDWGEQARAAAVNLERSADSTTARVRLLAAAKQIMAERDGDISSQTLIEELLLLPESEWVERSKGKPISQKQLANMLKPFRIFPQQVRANGHQVRGYLRAHFEDAWSRYL